MTSNLTNKKQIVKVNGVFGKNKGQFYKQIYKEASILKWHFEFIKQVHFKVSFN